MRYRCTRWPQLKIGDRIAFDAGVFETDDPDLMRQVEANDAYGVHIHSLDDADAPDHQDDQSPEMEDDRSPEMVEPRVRWGRRGSRG